MTVGHPRLPAGPGDSVSVRSDFTHLAWLGDHTISRSAIGSQALLAGMNANAVVFEVVPSAAMVCRYGYVHVRRGNSASWDGCGAISLRCDVRRSGTRFRYARLVWYYGQTITPAGTALVQRKGNHMTEFTDVTYEVDNGLAWITINRPERYNASPFAPTLSTN